MAWGPLESFLLGALLWYYLTFLPLTLFTLFPLWHYSTFPINGALQRESNRGKEPLMVSPYDILHPLTLVIPILILMVVKAPL